MPNTGYHFVDWSDGVLTATRTDTNVTANMTVTATFAINTYTLTYTAGANGTITGISPQTVNHGASGTAVTAVPNAGYHFVSWSDGVRRPTRTDTNVTADMTVTATFAINTYTLTYTAGANGTITGASPQTVNHGASGTAVTAVPDAGYHFVNWSDGVLTAARTDTNVTADMTVTATFAINTYTLTYTAGANGTITATSPQTVDHGGSGTAVTASAERRLPLRELERRRHDRHAHRHQCHGEPERHRDLRHQHLHHHADGRGGRQHQPRDTPDGEPRRRPRLHHRRQYGLLHCRCWRGWRVQGALSTTPSST